MYIRLPGLISEALRRCQTQEHLKGPVRELSGLLQARFTGLNLVTVTRREIAEAVTLVVQAEAQLTSERETEHWLLLGTGVTDDSILNSAGSMAAAGELKRCKVRTEQRVEISGTFSDGTVTAGAFLSVETLVGTTVLEVSGHGAVYTNAIAGDATVRIGHLSMRLPRISRPAVTKQNGSQLMTQPIQEVAERGAPDHI